MGRKCFTDPLDTQVWNLSTGSRLQTNTKKLLGERIRFYRLKAGLQQDELAEKTGVTSKAVSSWEVGASRPDLDNLTQICHTLEVSPAQLLGYDRGLTPDERTLLKNYRQLCRMDRHTIYTLAANLTQAREMREKEKIHLVRVKSAFHPLVAGIGLSEEWDDDCETIYLHDSPLARKTDYVFQVSGDSMEPSFHNGDHVCVEKVSPHSLTPGMIGAFQYENSTYIKEYTLEGLYSHNPKYDLMRFDETAEVLLIGRVIGTLSAGDFASDKEIDLFESFEND